MLHGWDAGASQKCENFFLAGRKDRGERPASLHKAFVFLHHFPLAPNAEAAEAVIERTLPDVVVLDMTMTESCKLAQSVAGISPNTRIVALAVPHDESNILEYAMAGIAGYVLREASIDDLIDAVGQAARGEFYCPPKIAACILKKVRNIAIDAKGKHSSDVKDAPSLPEYSPCYHCHLTRRERQIALLLSDGLSNKQIARDLSIEVSTVKNHVHNVLVKLDVKSRTQAISRLQKLPQYRVSSSMDLDLNPEVTSLSQQREPVPKSSSLPVS